MPVPYRKSPRSIATHSAAYLDVLWIRSEQTFYGALLLIDSRGQPLEFVHNTLSAPTGFLWPEEQVRVQGVAALSHSLFEACQREPEILVCNDSLGAPEFCRMELAPSIPFVQVVDTGDDSPVAWNWMNDPPTAGMAASSLSDELRVRGFALEPFSRIRQGLRELYPHAHWDEVTGDSGSQK